MLTVPIRIDKLNQCRICDSDCGELRSIESKSYKFTSKKYSELLAEVTNIESFLQQGLAKIPKYICLDCVSNLHNAYLFIKRVQRFEEQWEKCLRSSPQANYFSNTIYSNLKIFREKSPNETEENVVLVDSDDDGDGDENGNENVKLEYENEQMNGDEDESHGGAVSKTEESQVYKNFVDSVYNMDDGSVDISHWDEDEPYILDGSSVYDTEENSQLSQDDSNNQIENSAENDEEAESQNGVDYIVPAKRKRGRPRTKGVSHVRFTVNTDGRFICTICTKAFTWRKDLYQHYANHASEDFVCHVCGQTFNRKDKLKTHQEAHDKLRQHSSRWFFGNFLYNDKPFILKQCRLCHETFSQSNDLRNHLLQHAECLDVDLKLDSPYVRDKYPQATDIDQVVECINRKLREQEFEEFYLIRNHFGFEMSLSDSDEDCDDEQDREQDQDPEDDASHPMEPGSSNPKKYHCSLCEEYFPRKHLIFAHVSEKHKHELLPYKCNECKMGFVSEQMFFQHLKTQCQNDAKIYKCSKCPGRFVWAENLENHQCITTTNYKDLKSLEKESMLHFELKTSKDRKKAKDRFECALCQKMFKYRKALFTHYQKHKLKVGENSF